MGYHEYWFFVTLEAIWQWFSWVTKLQVKIIAKFPHPWQNLVFMVTHTSFYISLKIKGYLGHVSIWRCHLTGIGIPMIKIRQSHVCLIFNMGISIPGKAIFILKWGPVLPKPVYIVRFYNLPDRQALMI